MTRPEFAMLLPELPPFLIRWPDGEVVLTGTRVTLYDFVFHYNQGESAEMLGLRYPHVSLATVHKVIAFYLENKVAVDAYSDEYAKELSALRTAGPTLNLAELRERLGRGSAASKQVSQASLKSPTVWKFEPNPHEVMSVPLD